MRSSGVPSLTWRPGDHRRVYSCQKEWRRSSREILRYLDVFGSSNWIRTPNKSFAMGIGYLRLTMVFSGFFDPVHWIGRLTQEVHYQIGPINRYHEPRLTVLFGNFNRRRTFWLLRSCRNFVKASTGRLDLGNQWPRDKDQQVESFPIEGIALYIYI